LYPLFIFPSNEKSRLFHPLSKQTQTPKPLFFQLFAITRDKAIPFSGFLHWTHPTSKTPIVAVWVSAGLAFCFALFSLKSEVAFNAVTSLSTIGSMFAYGIPIFLKQLFPHNFHPGPFHLGR
jgi:hypothetical protein